MFRLPKDLYDRIVAQAREEAPNEACGYLAGTEDEAKAIIPMVNVDACPEHFSFDPKAQFDAVKRTRGWGLELIAVYHSHPATPARMSQEDIRLANDIRPVYLIYSMAEDRIRGFRIDRDKSLTDVPVELTANREEKYA
jgi:[CysO sulfur-carrier protein]-S-L-cysteine hydrolase